MRINHNIPAMRAQHSLGRTNGTMDKVMERLSSGLRINRAGDDAAGLAIANKMQTQVRGLKVAGRNALDGVSLVQTAEGALSEVQAMLQRMRELAVQGANGTLAAEDRRAIQNEVDQLKDEITKTANLTEFNKIKLLNGEIDRRSFTDNEKIVKPAFISDTVLPGDYSFTVTHAGMKAQTEGIEVDAFADGKVGVSGRVNINGEEVYIDAADTVDIVFAKLRDVCERVDITLTRHDDWGVEDDGFLSLVTKEYGSDQRIEILGSSTELLSKLGLVQYSDPSDPTSSKMIMDVVRGVDAKVTLNSASDFKNTATVTTRGNRVEITDANYQRMYLDIQVDESGSALLDGTSINTATAGVYTVALGTADITIDGTSFTYNATPGTGEWDDAASLAALINANTTLNEKYTATVNTDTPPGLVLTQKSGKEKSTAPAVAGTGSTMNTTTPGVAAGELTASQNVKLRVLDAGPLQLQIGPNEGMKLELQVPELTGTALGLDRINMRTAEGASQAISILDAAINEISSVRSKLGAYQNRLEHTIANLDSTSENTTAALSRIQDADMAYEMAEYTQKNILAQAGTAMLAQANQRPQSILQLLQG